MYTLYSGDFRNPTHAQSGQKYVSVDDAIGVIGTVLSKGCELDIIATRQQAMNVKTLQNLEFILIVHTHPNYPAFFLVDTPPDNIGDYDFQLSEIN